MNDADFIVSRQTDLGFPDGTLALAGLDLSIRRGEVVSLVGPSGCGKSTLLRLVAGLLQPGSGILTVAGMDPARARKEGHACAFVFQSPTLLPWRTVEANLTLPLELLKLPRTACRDRAQELLSLVGLSEFRDSYPARLSGGMRMRVSLARALAARPKVLLLDEPFAALDDLTRSRLQEELLSLRVREEVTVLFVTHSVTESVFLSDRVLVLSPRPGRVVGEVAIPFGPERAPELRSTAEFARLTGCVSRLLETGAAS
jgi:NitT/TauT family transport system ATP-binding protein